MFMTGSAWTQPSRSAMTSKLAPNPRRSTSPSARLSTLMSAKARNHQVMEGRSVRLQMKTNQEKRGKSRIVRAATASRTILELEDLGLVEYRIVLVETADRIILEVSLLLLLEDLDLEDSQAQQLSQSLPLHFLSVVSEVVSLSLEILRTVLYQIVTRIILVNFSRRDTGLFK